MCSVEDGVKDDDEVDEADGIDVCSCSSAGVTDAEGTGPFSPGTTPWGRCLTVPSNDHLSLEPSTNSLSALNTIQTITPW